MIATLENNSGVKPYTEGAKTFNYYREYNDGALGIGNNGIIEADWTGYKVEIWSDNEPPRGKPRGI